MSVYQSTIKKLVNAVALVTIALVLSGCNNFEGKDGKAGPAGSPGAAGAQGSAGQGVDPAVADDLQDQLDDVAASRAQSMGLAVESCTICHNDSAELHEIKDKNVFSVAAATVALNAATDTVVITATIRENGLLYTKGFTTPLEGAYSAGAYLAHLENGEWINDASVTYASTNRSTGVFSVSATNGGLLDESDAANGNYMATFPAADLAAADIDGTRTYRVVFYARAYRDTNGNDIHGSGDGDYRSYVNAVADVQGTLMEAKDLVDPGACFQCHYDGNYLAHGGRADARFCVVCHNPEYMADEVAGQRFEMVNLIHGLHSSEHNEGFDISGDNDGSELVEIGFPQSMTNCATCHQGAARIAAVTDSVNYKPELCQSCHGGADKPFSIANFDFDSDFLTGIHADFDETTACVNCHDGVAAPLMAQIHDGYDVAKRSGREIAYYDPMVTVNGSTLTVVWGAYDVATGTAYDVTNTDRSSGPVFMEYYPDRNNESDGVRILIGYYGWGTNDVAALQSFTSNTSGSSSLWPITTFSSASGKATTTITLTTDNLDEYMVSRGVVGIIGVPTIDGQLAAVKSVATDFNFDGTQATARDDIVDNDLCSTCHDNLLIHSPDPYGHTAVGEVRVCVICHNPTRAAGHYEQQSRSLKSYIHAVHSEQPTFTHYGSHPGEGHAIEYPGRLDNCESCHFPGTYEVPNMLKSSGGLVSGFEDSATGVADGSQIAITGPAAIACGSCHKAMFLRESGRGHVSAFNSHTANYGYRVDAALMSLQEAMEYLLDLL